MWKLLVFCGDNPETLHPEAMTHAAREQVSSKKLLLNTGDGSDTGPQQTGCLTSAFPDVAEVQPQCGFYYIINIMIQIKHDCSTIEHDLILISTTILL